MRELSAEGLELLATIERDGMQESFHHGVVAVVDPDGNLISSKGDVFALIYPRSALKPVQASAMKAAGLSLSEAQRVMTMASHYATEQQVGLVAAILASQSVSEEKLGCPEALPWNSEARIGASPKRIQMNCSGKHAGFLATSKLNGWDLDSYLAPEHPMQLLVKQRVEELSGEKIERNSTDGCGAPLYALSTHGLAKAVSNFAQQEPELVSAAISHPDLIGDVETPDSGFLRAGLFSKLGAEGVFTVATNSGHGLAMKIADGSLRMAATYSAVLLRRLGLITESQMTLAIATEKTEVKGGDQVIGGWEFYF